MSDKSDKPESGDGELVDPAYVRRLAEVLNATGLVDLEIKQGDVKIRLSRAVAPQVMSVVPATVQAAGAPQIQTVIAKPQPADAEAGDMSSNAGVLKSPMVGTAFRKPTPEAKPFVEVGSQVRAGERVLLIEAMKTFNDIMAHRAGTVTAILVEDGQPVEYGEPLLIIE
jgi:acetyl-CoA carboxylase biotin carboxyl carrier protein